VKPIRTAVLLCLMISSLLIVAGCGGGQTMAGYLVPTGGNPRAGRAVIEQYGCGSCHIIPGIPNANGLVGPPLMKFARRTFIAGVLPNTPQNLVDWLLNPPSIVPQNAMPDLGLTQQQARDAAAYLYTLR
jgi:cytochrome c